MRRFFSEIAKVSRRRVAFEFEPLNYDESVSVKLESGESIEIPLEAHPIGSHGPSLIPFDESLLDVLACPITGKALVYDKERNLLISEEAKVGFPINKAGIPIFLKKWAIMLD